MSSDGQSLQYPDLNTKLIVTICHSESQFLRRRESDSISVGHVSADFFEVCVFQDVHVVSDVM